MAGCRAGAASVDLRAEVERRLRLDRLMDRWFSALRPPQLEDIRGYYKQNREAFRSPEMVRVSHIVKNVAEGDDSYAAEETMIRARELLLAGAAFAEVARGNSDCLEKGGDLGYFPRGVMVEEFDSVVFSAPVGH
jgi:parvulin-like peptidyl-prolyl isomerase